MEQQALTTAETVRELSLDEVFEIGGGGVEDYPVGHRG